MAKEASRPTNVSMRLNRYLALCGLGSRRSVEDLILSGKVKVNGRIVKDLATQISLGNDKVEVGGAAVQSVEKKIYLMLNKPKGYDVTRNDSHSHRRAYDLLPRGTHPSVKAVGRLDRDSTGLLLFTNDGDLAHRLTHPSFGCPKTYMVEVEGNVTREELAALQGEIQLEDGPAKAEQVTRLSVEEGTSKLRIVITLGRNRIVRRMCEAIGHPVLALHRTNLGGLALGDLARGHTRPLLHREASSLREGVKLYAEKKIARDEKSGPSGREKTNRERNSRDPRRRR